MAEHYVFHIKLEKVTRTTPTVVGHRGGMRSDDNAIVSTGTREVEEIFSITAKGKTEQAAREKLIRFLIASNDEIEDDEDKPKQKVSF